jgi:hypothetical protein
MNDMNLVMAINAATRILAARVLSMIGLLMVFGLACWAMIVGTILSLVLVGGFALLVFLPVLWQDHRNGE